MSIVSSCQRHSSNQLTLDKHNYYHYKSAWFWNHCLFLPPLFIVSSSVPITLSVKQGFNQKKIQENTLSSSPSKNKICTRQRGEKRWEMKERGKDMWQLEGRERGRQDEFRTNTKMIIYNSWSSCQHRICNIVHVSGKVMSIHKS